MLSRRTALALLGLGALGAGATRSAAKPDTDRWKKDRDAQGNDLVNLGDLSFAAAPEETVSSLEDLRLDVRDLGSNTTIPGVETLSIGSGLVATADGTGATVNVEGTPGESLGVAVSKLERQMFDGTEPDPRIEWDHVDFVHPDVVTFDDGTSTFTIEQDGIYDVRVLAFVNSIFGSQGEPTVSSYADLRVIRLPGRSDILARAVEFSPEPPTQPQKSIAVTRVLPLEEGDQIVTTLSVLAMNRQQIGGSTPSYMSIVRLE